MASYKPNTVQFELVQGCNRQCSFCGTNGFERKLHFIEKDVLKKQCELVVESGYNPRILLAGHGENTLHPNFTQCVKLMRRLMPKQHIQILTNGYNVQKDLTAIGDMFNAGINDITLDEYGDTHFDEGDIADMLEKNGFDLSEIKIERMDKGVPLYAPKSPRSKRVLVIPAIDESEIATSRKLTNHCGAGMPPDNRLKRRVCTRIFREMSYRWDGSVCICCQDFRGQYYVENVMNVDKFDDIWLHERFEAARRILYHKKRIFFPCSVCNLLPMREGLLPDHKGKEDMPKPKKSDLQIVRQKHKPLTKIVKREWEED